MSYFKLAFDVPDSWSEKNARKKAEAYAATFERECKTGVRSDTKQTFASYCDYVINLKEQRGIKHSTIIRYKALTARIYPEIGHIKLQDLRPHSLNELYTSLSADGVNKHTGGKLNNKTIIEHHRLISTVLEQAVKEELIPFNIAARASLPKADKKEVNYFQPEQVKLIREALEKEPIKWKTLVHLFLVTGARRGEILGLKWDKIDFENRTINISTSILYSPERGVYEDTPKTLKSNRKISLPTETIDLLTQYRTYQLEKRLMLGSYYQNKNFIFTQ